ncbi:MAG: ParB N-terminal domain-containing protein [Bosea sp.]|uniref:ParB/RepB/Spo0J family partition protein n=1 Tax=unclassified Bosea (in: a-proteobacteria) TaxID=2653178 RepID=UPI000962D956|nr:MULTISPECIES: ParB/RepB/Spo0J family partition protein [unclassified Bosea (in: a-proteobacteria)]MBN9459035.1 ParB N-terminal domain-containing protein [Bosea sp. (in: a-proteobacteria)]OJV06223.1 MAG: hypothetical protein BGO20_08175 [Bosea sp. 67-29]
MIDADFQEDVWPKAADDALEIPPPLPDDTTVPLDRLDEGGDDNVRTSASKVEIEALAASIAHRGLLQPLVVATAGGRYKVGAGNRRLKALKLLAKRGTIPKDHPVRVTFAAARDLHEISLTENVMRVQLHPVDEFEAFRDLQDSGLAVAEIADRFGLKERQVRQRLALGGLAPEVRKAWRDGRIGQEKAEAFTLCDDHDVQREALAAGLKSKSHWNEWEVSRILRAGREQANSSAMSFVGREAYLAAGGTLREDLFGDIVLVEAPDILSRLWSEKVEVLKQELLGKGWAFAVHRGEVERSYLWARLPLDRWMTDEEKAAAKRGGNAGWNATQAATRRAADDAAARAASGVIIEIQRDGSVELDVLRLRPAQVDSEDGEEIDDEDDTGNEHGDADGNFADADDEEADSSASTAAEDTGPDLPRGLSENLSDDLGDVIAECLVADPVLALRAAIAGLTASRWGSPVRLQQDGSPRRKLLYHDFSFTDRFAELAALDREQLLVEFAKAVAGALETRRSQVDMDPKLASGRDVLVAAIAPDAFRAAVTKAFDPGRFFAQAPGAVAKAAAEEAGAGTIKGKKAELAERATELATATGWLPGPLRTVHYQPQTMPGETA